MAYEILAASAAHLGDDEEARAALDSALELHSNWSEEWLSLIYPNPEMRGRFLEGLRMAGLED